jgi:hypothetical protein
MLRYIRDKGKPINKTVESFIEEFINPHINIFRKRNGWPRFGNHKNKYINICYPERNNDEGEKSWVYLIPPQIDNHIKFEHDENILFLFKGEKNLKPHQMSLYEYSNTEVFGDAVYVIPNFQNITNVLGINILQRRKEIPRVYRFMPWNMLCPDEIKPLSEYDIYIVNDKEKKSEERIKYIDSVMNGPLDILPHLFGLDYKEIIKVNDVNTVTDGPSMNSLIKKCIRFGKNNDNDDFFTDKTKPIPVIRSIRKGSVKSPYDYYNHIKKNIKADKASTDILNDDLENKIDFISVGSDIETTYDGNRKLDYPLRKKLKDNYIFGFTTNYRVLINKISGLVNFLTEHCVLFDNYMTKVGAVHNILVTKLNNNNAREVEGKLFPSYSYFTDTNNRGTMGFGAGTAARLSKKSYDLKISRFNNDNTYFELFNKKEKKDIFAYCILRCLLGSIFNKMYEIKPEKGIIEKFLNIYPGPIKYEFIKDTISKININLNNGVFDVIYGKDSQANEGNADNLLATSDYEFNLDIKNMEIGKFLEICFENISLYKIKGSGDRVKSKGLNRNSTGSMSNFKAIFKDMLKIGIDSPVGFFLFKRQVYETLSTPYCRKHGIEQKSMKLMVSVTQEFPAGNIHAVIWKGFGEKLLEPRNIINFRDTYIEKCILGGGNR